MRDEVKCSVADVAWLGEEGHVRSPETKRIS